MLLTGANVTCENDSLVLSVFAREDQSAYYYCLFLFVSAGKRMYLQHHALKVFISLWK